MKQGWTALFCAALITLLLTNACKRGNSVPSATEHVARVGANTEPHSLDPRAARMLSAATVLNLLYEGLLREDAEGNLEPAMAESMTVSADGKTYSFRLREAKWSNGDPVTSKDFVYAWKSVLSPSFAAPNAFQLYPIKNARAAKEGRVAVDEIGIKAPDERTLIVQLEQPTAYFPRLLAFHAYFPVNHQIAQAQLDWADGNTSNCISNGPFLFTHWKRGHELSMRKNAHYWDAGSVQLNGVDLVITDENTALELFEMNELDWTGSPLSVLPVEAMDSLEEQGFIHSTAAAATHWLRVNVDAPVVSNTKIRQALALAIDRQALVDHVIQGNQLPAMGVLPPNAHWSSPEYFQDHDLETAQELWQEGLGELGLPADAKPHIVFSYNRNERDHTLAQALQQQWYQTLGAWIELEALEGKLLYEKLKAQDYQLASGSWFADFEDPYNFLAVFEAKDNGTNNTGWEDKQYKRLLAESSIERDEGRRRQLLLSVEARLMDEMPVIPLFFYRLNAVKHPNLVNARLSGLGILQLRNAQFLNPQL